MYAICLTRIVLDWRHPNVTDTAAATLLFDAQTQRHPDVKITTMRCRKFDSSNYLRNTLRHLGVNTGGCHVNDRPSCRYRKCSGHSALYVWRDQQSLLVAVGDLVSMAF